MLDTNLAQDILLVPAEAGAASLEGSDVTFTASLVRKRPLPGELDFDQDEPVQTTRLLRGLQK